MIDPFSNFRKYMMWTFILIIFLIISGIAVAGEKSEWLNDNPCMIKVIITEKEICKDSMCLIKQTITEKEEVLKCKDGYDGLIIGNYLLSFTIQELRCLLIVDRMQDQIILLKHQGCYV